MTSRVSLSGTDSDYESADWDVPGAPHHMTPSTPVSVANEGPPGNFGHQGRAPSDRVLPPRPRPRRVDREVSDDRLDARGSTRGRSPGSVSPLPSLERGAPRYDGPPQGTRAARNDSPGRGLASLSDNPEIPAGGGLAPITFPPVPPNLRLEIPGGARPGQVVGTLTSAAQDLSQEDADLGHRPAATTLLSADLPPPRRGVGFDWGKPASDRFGEWWFSPNTLGEFVSRGVLDKGRFLRFWVEPQPRLGTAIKAAPAVVYILSGRQRTDGGYEIEGAFIGCAQGPTRKALLSKGYGKKCPIQDKFILHLGGRSDTCGFPEPLF